MLVLGSALLCPHLQSMAEEADSSPWLTVPVVSSEPRVGTSAGGIAGYVHRFDPDSPVSTLGPTANHSTTDSYTAGLFAKTFFGADRHRLTAVIAAGKVRNDYDDFLGSGLPVQTTDDLRIGLLR
ncbi:MAG: hypothetical protein V2I63_08130 [Pseudomonadales bacterium]|nr:hypothetical protein [Pseudomonadales bacterium]